MSDPSQPVELIAYPALIGALLAKVPEPVSPEERSYYLSRIHDDDARDAGARVESASILDDVLFNVTTALPYIMAKKVPGYGPLRLRHLLDNAKELADNVAELDTAVVDAAGAGAAKTTTLRDTRVLRRSAVRALKNLAGRDEEALARVRKAAKGLEKPDERARSLQAIAEELAVVAEKVPARVAEDAGVTPDLMESLRTNATAVLSARGKAHGTRGSIASLYDEMNVLDGRILHELRLLIGAFSDARTSNPSIPKLRSKLLQKPRKKTPAKDDRNDTPTPDAAKPSPGAAKPAPDAAKLTPEAAKPTPEAAKPTPEAAKPTPDAAKPTSEASTTSPKASTPA